MLVRVCDVCGCGEFKSVDVRFVSIPKDKELDPSGHGVTTVFESADLCAKCKLALYEKTIADLVTRGALKKSVVDVLLSDNLNTMKKKVKK